MSEVIKSETEAGIGMITYLVNQIIEGVISTECGRM